MLATIVAGGYVAGTEYHGTENQPVVGAHSACGSGWSAEQFPGCNGQGALSFGQSRLADIQLTHRLFMYLTAISLIAMTALALRRRAPSRAFWLAPLILVAQIALGAINVWAGKHAGLIVGHLALGTTLWATVVYATATLMPASAPAIERVDAPTGDRGGPGLMESATTTIALARERSFAAVVRDYVELTKPRIISLLLLTTVATMIVAEGSFPEVSTLLWTMLGGYLAAGGAGAINHYLDRERDARMARTRGRPLVAGRIEPLHGLTFGIVLGALATVELALTVNLLSSMLALTGLLGYVLMYTVWLKPLTPQNIVIGGAAGAVPPLVGWAAATGGLAPEALYPFGIVFLWTPPHFWALSLLISDDYARAGVPMLPVVKGEAATRRQILVYTLILVAFTLLPVATGFLGALYAGAALVLGAGFAILAVRLLRHPTRPAALRLYLSSLAYLALLFCAMAVDAVV